MLSLVFLNLDVCMQLTGQVIFAFSISALLLTSCSKQRSFPLERRTVKINYGHSELLLHPHKASVQSQIALVHHIGEGLMRLSKKSVPELALAKSVLALQGGKKWKVTLKDDLYWSDGHRLTVDHFIQGWYDALTHQVNAPLVNLLFCIENAEKIYEKKIPLSALGIKKVDDHVMCIDLEQPIPYFLHLLTAPIFFPISPHLNDTKREYPSCGPFQIAKANQLASLTLERNHAYWDAEAMVHKKNFSRPSNDGDTAPIECIEFFQEKNPRKQLEQLDEGILDFCGTPFLSIDPSDVWEYPFKHEYRSVNVPELSTWMLALNTRHPILHNKNIRKAIAFSLMRERWIEQGVYTGVASKGLVPPELFDSPQSVAVEEDLILARNLFQKGVSELNLSPKEISLELSYAEDWQSDSTQAFARSAKAFFGLEVSSHAKRAHVIKERLYNALSVHITLCPLDRETFRLKQKEGKFTLSTFCWVADYPHPLAFLELFLDARKAYNFSRWENSHYTQNLLKAKRSSSRKVQDKLLQQAHDILLDELPVIPLVHPGSLALFSPYLGGLVFHPEGYLDLRWAHLRK